MHLVREATDAKRPVEQDGGPVQGVGDRGRCLMFRRIVLLGIAALLSVALLGCGNPLGGTSADATAGAANQISSVEVDSLGRSVIGCLADGYRGKFETPSVDASATTEKLTVTARLCVDPSKDQYTMQALVFSAAKGVRRAAVQEPKLMRNEYEVVVVDPAGKTVVTHTFTASEPFEFAGDGGSYTFDAQRYPFVYGVKTPSSDAWTAGHLVYEPLDPNESVK